jgi:UrcA family protein
MNMTDKILKISLFAVLAFSQTPAFAEDGPMVVEGKSVFQERVGYRDLDLRVGEDQRILRKRVFAASDRVCVAADGPNYRSNVTMSGSARVPGGLNCADLSFRAARPQIRAAIARAQSGEQVALGDIVIGIKQGK